MTHPDILVAPVRERSGTFLAEAEAARRARQARRHLQPGRASGTRTTPLRQPLPWLQGRSLRPGGQPRRAAEERGVGVARYVRDATTRRPPRSPSPSRTTGRPGDLGTGLLSRLSDRARQAGIHRFTALAAAENAAVAGQARKLGACPADRGPGTVEYQIALVPVEYSLDW